MQILIMIFLLVSCGKMEHRLSGKVDPIEVRFTVDKNFVDSISQIISVCEGFENVEQKQQCKQQGLQNFFDGINNEE